MLLVKRSDNYYLTADFKHYIKCCKSGQWVIGRRVLTVRIPLQKASNLSQARHKLERGIHNANL